jgi:cytochrome c-type biogenesis protein CcmE
MKPAHIMALILLISSMAFTLYAFTGAIAPHVSIDQVMANEGKTVQVPGSIQKQSVTFDAKKGQLKFEVIGVDRDGKTFPDKRLWIVYNQPKPENFDDATTVEAIGKFKGGVFVADNLLVKCPSKYGDDEKVRNPYKK